MLWKHKKESRIEIALDIRNKEIIIKIEWKWNVDIIASREKEVSICNGIG